MEGHEIAYLIIAFFCGITLGQLMAGWAAKTFERIWTLMFCASISFGAAFISAFATRFWFFILCRFVLGWMGGILLPIGCSIITEVVPTAHRMKVIAFLVNGGIGFLLGELFAISLAWVYLDNLQSGNWRGYLLTLSLTLGLTIIGVWAILVDSPRHLLS